MSLPETFDIHYHYYYNYCYCAYCTSFSVDIRRFHVIWKKANQSQPKKNKNYIFVQKCRYIYFLLHLRFLKISRLITPES